MPMHWVISAGVVALFAAHLPINRADDKEKGLQSHWLSEKFIAAGRESMKDEEMRLEIDDTEEGEIKMSNPIE